MENQPTPGKTNAGQGLGIAALVLGIITIPFALFPCTAVFAWCPGAVAIILGAIALNQAKKGNGKTGLPMAGLVLGIIATALAVAWIVVFAEGAKEVSDAIKQDTTLMQGLDSLMQQMDSVMRDTTKQN